MRASAKSAGKSERFLIRSGRHGQMFLYNAHCGCHLNHRFRYVVRGHGEGGSAAKRVFSSRLEISYFDKARLYRTHALAATSEVAARRPLYEQLAKIQTLGASNEARVVAFGLYGGDDRYTLGVVRNAELVPLVYAGWHMRVYHDDSVPPPVLAHLRTLDVQLVQLRREDNAAMSGGIGGMFWRFLVAADKSVDRFVVRDCDSRLNPRERLAVEEWIASGLSVHSMRDHPNHDRPLNGGMWGGLRAVVPDMAELVRAWSNRDQCGWPPEQSHEHPIVHLCEHVCTAGTWVTWTF